MALLRAGPVLLLWLPLNACAQGHSAPLTDAGASGAGSGTTAGASSGASSASGSSGSGTTGNTTSSSTGSGTGPTSGTTSSGTGAAPCVWIGDVCSQASCANASIGEPCVLDGGPGVCQGGQCVPQLLNATNGACGPDQTDRFCAPGAYCCDGGCLDVYAEDPLNCGGCGVQCSTGTVCLNGSCVPSHACLPTENGLICTMDSGVFGTCCQGSCVDLTSDPGHCGGCSRTCLAGSSCMSFLGEGYCGPGGSCSQSSNPCPTGYLCGSFQNAANAYCVLSACGAGTDRTECALDDGGELLGECCGGACIDVSRDPSNCGGCGLTCVGSDTCFLGSCGTFSSCPANGDICLLDGGAQGSCCEGSCVASESILCGATSCYADGGCMGSASCVGGLCIPAACDGGNTACQGGVCCGTGCVDLANDSQNCGSCGAICPVGVVCRGGYCLGSCNDCPRSYYCDYGDFHACDSPSCNPSLEGQTCASTVAGGERGTCCNGSCVTGLDPNNCGRCGVSCATGICEYLCDGLGCRIGCSTGVPTAACLQSCGFGTVCVGVSCVGSACNPEIPDQPCLDEDGGIGLCCNYSCADLKSDSENCGACGIACPAGTQCESGYCNGLRACGPGTANGYCDVDAGLSFICCPGVGCVDTGTDPQNCGSCGQACAAGQSCRFGGCQ
jgi:hypothetical protein